MDISATDRTKFEVFQKLVETGPNTSYGLYIALKKGKDVWRQSTVHRTVKILEKAFLIELYSEEMKNGRSRKVYGPTLSGLFFVSFHDKSFLDNVGNIFEKCLDEPKFSQNDSVLELFGTEMLENNPKKAKSLFKVLYVYSAKMIEKWRDYEPQIGLADEITLGDLIFRGENPKKYLQLTKILTHELPGFKKAHDTAKRQNQQLFDFLEV